MAYDIPETEPGSITAGNTIKWTKSLPDYLPADSWVLSYSLFNASNQYDVAATDNGDGTHLVNIAVATSGTYAAGDYNWQSFVTKAGERYMVEGGEIRINADPAAAAVDGRTHVKKVLDAINTTLETRAAQKNESYSIADVSITRQNTESLLALKTKYEAWYAQEQKATALAKGLGHSSRVRVRI